MTNFIFAKSRFSTHRKTHCSSSFLTSKILRPRRQHNLEKPDYYRGSTGQVNDAWINSGNCVEHSTLVHRKIVSHRVSIDPGASKGGSLFGSARAKEWPIEQFRQPSLIAGRRCLEASINSPPVYCFSVFRQGWLSRGVARLKRLPLYFSAISSRSIVEACYTPPIESLLQTILCWCFATCFLGVDN